MKKIAVFLYRRRRINPNWAKRIVVNPETKRMCVVENLPLKYRLRFKPKRKKIFIDPNLWLNKKTINPVTGNRARVKSLPLQYRDVYRPPDSPKRETHGKYITFKHYEK
jgi:hypothetical protein